jgi:pimeloyl-ACP methyl ester carboxylesterase
MPAIDVRGAHLRYEVVGERGSWVALMPGGRRPLDAVRSLGQRIAAAGYRVLLHDRRNCGASDVIIEGAASESEIWADDLHALLQKLGASPAYVGGSSSGCRTALIHARRHPRDVRDCCCGASPAARSLRKGWPSSTTGSSYARRRHAAWLAYARWSISASASPRVPRTGNG